ncbi:MAG: OmpP1/FadL family transporter [Kofleriaceae bacterium]
MRATAIAGALAAAGPLVAAGSLAHAGGFAVSTQSAVSGGTAGAGVARDDDPSAAWHVPAALADGGGLRFDASLIFARPSLEARALDGSWSSSNEAAWSTPPHLDVSYARGPWAAGVSLGVPFGSGVTWPANWAGQHESISTELQVFRAAPFVAWRFGALRISAGVHVDQGRLQIARDLDFIDTEGSVAIDVSGTGVGGHASLYWQARPDLALGVAYRSRTRLPMRGGANFTTPAAFADKAPDQHAETTMTLPDQLVLGGRYVRGRYAALLDVELTTWSTHARTVIDFEREMTTDVTQQNGWGNTVAVRAGGELAHRQLVFRHGAYLDQSPAPTDRLAPSSPDSTRLGLSMGLGWRFHRTWSIDGFVESMWLLRRSSANVDALEASYGGHAMLLGFGIQKRG